LAMQCAHKGTMTAVLAYHIAIRIRLARGDVRRALVDAEPMLEIGRASREPQVRGPALAAAAFARLAAGERDECATLADETIEFMNWDSLYTYLNVGPLLGPTLHALGRGAELTERAARVSRRTPWLEAAAASAAGDFTRAAAVYERMGDRPDEAYARLEAAEQLIAEGRGAEADAHLARALAFFRSVGATGYVEAGERMLAAST
jgi:tetratricopeptide (TPR) repeat protein